MTIDEKVEIFYQITMDDARAQSVAMIEEYEASVEEQYKAQKEALKDKANQYYQREKEILYHDKNKTISATQRDVKRQVVEEVESFKNILFSDVLQKLLAFKKTDAYKENLIRQIKGASSFAEQGPVTVYMNADDEKIVKEIEKETGVTITISKTDFIGGVRIVMKDKNILIDNSYLARLTEERNAYKMQ